MVYVRVEDVITSNDESPQGRARVCVCGVCVCVMRYRLPPLSCWNLQQTRKKRHNTAVNAK